MGPIGIEPIANPDVNWNININTVEIQNLRGRYITEITEDDFQRVVETSSRLMSNFPSPQGPPRVVSGLALGKVQSGKTLSFTTLIALASSNSYRIIVVLAGTKKNLYRQTKDRLEKDLGINEANIEHNIVMIPNPKVRDVATIRGTLDTGRCALIVCMKNRSRIRPVTRLLSSPELRDRSPVLIIDDEGDEASLNTEFRDGTQSSTYTSIIELRGSVPRCVYIAYTATPQAPLLLQQLDALHPEFCVLVEPGPGYCGGSVFFGENINNHVRTIRDEHIIDEGGIPESLQDALAVFFVGAAIRHTRNPNDKHSMLIHTSHLQESHSRLEESVSQLHERWRSRIRFMDNDPGKQDLIQRFQSAYNDLIGTINNPPDWAIVSQRLDFELHATRIWVFNSAERRGEDEPQFQLENNIVIGGNMLGRGVTIKNLSVTYITRRAEGETNADTLEQRARWFGYKRSYLDLCRVYLTQQLQNDYIELLRHEDDFWNSLRRYSEGLPVSQWRPLLLLYNENDTLRPTRSNVASYTRLRSTGWTIMQPSLNQEIANRNLEIIDSFFREHVPMPYPNGGVIHQIVQGYPVLQVIGELIRNIVPGEQGDEWNSAFVIEYLSRLLALGRLLNIDVVLMHGVDSGFRRRSPVGDNQVNGSINPMEGRSANYLGDRYIPNGRPQLQVHKILYDGTNKVRTCLLALYMPNADDYNLEQFYVRVDI